MKKERWRKIKGFPGYEVSDHGRIRSRIKGGARQRLYTSKPRIIKPQVVDNGRKSPHIQHIIRLRDVTHKRSTHLVHRLVLQEFIGPCPANKPICRHLDGNGGNNHYRNLAWGTHKDNKDDSVKHGTYARGSMMSNTTLTENDVLRIRYMYTVGGIPSCKLSKLFGVSSGGICNIVKRRTWKHI